jgi:multidrug resistance efflux pump
MKRRIPLLIGAVIVLVALYFVFRPRPHQITLTGIVTTDDVIVSPEIQGRIQQLLVNRGDIVTNNQLLAALQPQEWKADMAFYANTEQQLAAQVEVAEADLKFQESQTSNQILQAEATLASTQAQVTQAKADFENAQLNFKRQEDLYKRQVEAIQSYDQARTTREGAEARVESLQKQVLAAEAALALAKGNADQVAARRATLEANKHQQAAAAAQKEKARVRLDYTQLRAPIDGVVDVRAAREGEVVNPGQAVVTLINPDNLWVRVDVEETYLENIQVNDKLKIRLPSGAILDGTVFHRGVDADYATQRDVNRSKRDIKTFEFRLRCDNRDRRLAVGMTAYVTVPLNRAK